MGGNIAWTIRRENGEEHRMSRWTNIMPDTIGDPAFLAGDDTAFAEAMKSYLEMKDDWERNGPDGEFQFNMTPVYAPYPYGLKPDEYGVIVTDFHTKTLISANHYTSFDHIFVMARMWPQFESDETGYEDRIERFTKLYEEGRITKLWLYDKATRTHNKVDVPAATDFKNMVWQSCILANDTIVNFDIDPPKGWTFLHFNSNSKEGRAQTYQAVLDLGFVLNEDEHAGWNEWLNPEEDDDE